jgi:hypothetical protein
MLILFLGDEQFEQGHVVERFSQKEYLIYTEMKSLFPIQSRDFCALTTIESNMSTGGIYIVSSSVVDTLVPESEKHTRGDILVNGFALEPVKSKQGRLIGVKVIFINHLNMGGVTPLPSSITRLLTTEVPYCLDRIESFLDQKGCPPYIRRVAGKVTLEHFEDTIYRMEFIAKHAPSRQYRKNRTSSISNMWCTDLRIHSSMYKNGFEITTEPKEDVRIEIKPDGSGLRIFTERSEMDGKTIRLLIEPIHELSPGVKPQFIWNNTPLILENVARAYKNKNIAEKPDKLNRSIAKQGKNIIILLYCVYKILHVCVWEKNLKMREGREK